MAGLFRVRCLNSLATQTGTINAVKERHSGGVQHKVIEGTLPCAGRGQTHACRSKGLLNPFSSIWRNPIFSPMPPMYPGLATVKARHEADPGDDRDPRRPPSSAPRDLTVLCVAIGRAFAHSPPPPSRQCHRPLRRVARIERAPRGSTGACPSPVLDPGPRALTAIVEFILRSCSTVFQPLCRQTARPRPERAEKRATATSINQK
jgi:hypothetical protein